MVMVTEVPPDMGPVDPQMRGRCTSDVPEIPKRPHSRARRLRMYTVDDIDRRTRAYRRAKAAVAELVDALGGPEAITPAQRHACERAGMFVAVAEDLVARRLAGIPGDPDELFRAEGVARRAVQAVLATKREPPQERPGLQYARRRWAQQDAARAAQAKEKDQ